MIGSKISFVFMLVLIHLPFLIINLERAVPGADPRAFHGVASIVLVLLLLFSGFVMGYTHQTFYLRWFSAYWLVGVFFMVVGYLLKLYVILVPFVLLYAVPLYGLVHYTGHSEETVYPLVHAVVGWGAGLVGYGIGHSRFRRRTPEQAT